MAGRSFLGAGDIYINRMVDGVSVGMAGPFYADKLEIQPKVETKQKKSKGRYTYGQVIAAVNLAEPTEFTLELSEISGDILTMAFLGSSAALNVAAGSLTNKEVTVAKHGQWLELGATNLDDLISVTDEAGTGTLSEGTDYELNRPLGWIRALEGGAVDVGDKMKVSGSYKATTGTTIRGSTRTEVRAHIVFDGVNQDGGAQCTVNIWEAVLAADSALDFLADDFGNVSLKGTLATPIGKTEPFKIDMQNPVA